MFLRRFFLLLSLLFLSARLLTAEVTPHQSPWPLQNDSSKSVIIGAHGMPIYIDNPERLKGFKAASMIFGTNTRLHEVMLCNEFNGNLLSVISWWISPT